MSYVDLVEDTICALITAPGPAGISVIRVSGQRSLDILRQFSHFLPDRPESHRVYFGTMKDSQGYPLDEVLITYFKKGSSFTGDETLEVSTHGGFMTANRVLTEIVAKGARPAEKGEFSFRAFYNGKIDLVQAEGILSIIESKSESARTVAIKQLKGMLSSKFETIEDQLITILAHLEASIDFSTEDIEPHSIMEIQAETLACLNTINGLLDSYSKGKILKDGFRTVLAGAPNAGKSSLYNILLGEEKAIVTDIAGTTRDTLHGQYVELGSSVELVDSAGLRESTDKVEKIGVERTKSALAEADAIFFVCDVENLGDSPLESITNYLDKTYFLVNKVDKLESSGLSIEDVQKNLEDRLNIQIGDLIYMVSAKNLAGIEEIRSLISNLSQVNIDNSELMVTQYRHFDYLTKAKQHMEAAFSLLKTEGSYDLIALEVQTCLQQVYGLLGKEYDDQVLDKVFKQFCIGK